MYESYFYFSTLSMVISQFNPVKSPLENICLILTIWHSDYVVAVQLRRVDTGIGNATQGNHHL